MALITSCYKSVLVDPVPLGNGAVEVTITLPTPEQSVTAEDATTPESYTVIIDNEVVSVDKDSTAVFEDLEPREYTIYVYSNTSEMSIENNIDESGEGSIISSKEVDAGGVQSLTEDLYFGMQTATVLADEVVTTQVMLWQVTRTIKFNLQITEGDPDRIASVEASLSGIVQQWECVADVPMGESVTINPIFTRGESLVGAEDGSANDYLTSSIKVLGVQGEEQDLVLVITYTDGTTQRITSSLGEEFVGSNDTKSTPLILEGDLTTPIEGATEGATIDNWRPGSGGSQTVN